MSKRKKITLVIPLVISFLMLILSVWCSRQEVLNVPKADLEFTFNVVDSDTEYRSERPLTTIDTKTEIPSSELKFVELPTTKGMKTYVEGKLTVKKGGHLHLDYHEPSHSPGRIRIKIDLKARPHSVSADGIWSLRLDTEYLMIDFALSPESIEFINPATLHINAQNLGLSGMNPDNIGLYYYEEDDENSEEEGEWELIEPIYLRVDVSKGHIVGCWHIDHFSRYAIASR